jgi:hypothetical protein
VCPVASAGRQGCPKGRRERKKGKEEREREALEKFNFFTGLKGLQSKIFAASGEKVRSKRKEKNFFGLYARLVNSLRSMRVKSDRPIRDINTYKPIYTEIDNTVK